MSSPSTDLVSEVTDESSFPTSRTFSKPSVDLVLSSPLSEVSEHGPRWDGTLIHILLSPSDPNNVTTPRSVNHPVPTTYSPFHPSELGVLRDYSYREVTVSDDSQDPESLHRTYRRLQDLSRI